MIGSCFIAAYLTLSAQENLEPGLHYDWSDWPLAWSFGAYAAGMAVILVLLDKAALPHMERSGRAAQQQEWARRF